MHRLADPLQDSGEGGDGLVDKEDEADVCWAPELVSMFPLKSASRHAAVEVVVVVVVVFLEGIEYLSMLKSERFSWVPTTFLCNLVIVQWIK